ncbi:MAG: hypothetical protein KGD63_09415 [Candidatus Lokiarchaeota archaeon]|nr:hypothetical protein [Candidatus Lokiarchaeota archaeon]
MRKKPRNNHLIKLFEEKYFLKRIDKAKDIIITLLEKDFFDKMSQFKWQDEEERQIFIKEMLALSPDERKIILDNILGDFNFKL